MPTNMTDESKEELGSVIVSGYAEDVGRNVDHLIIARLLLEM